MKSVFNSFLLLIFFLSLFTTPCHSSVGQDHNSDRSKPESTSEVGAPENNEVVQQEHPNEQEAPGKTEVQNQKEDNPDSSNKQNDKEKQEAPITSPSTNPGSGSGRHACTDDLMLLFSPDLQLHFLENSPTYLISVNDDPYTNVNPTLVKKSQKKTSHQKPQQNSSNKAKNPPKGKFWARSELMHVQEVGPEGNVLAEFKLNDCDWFTTCENNDPKLSSEQNLQPESGQDTEPHYEYKGEQKVSFECELKNGAFVQVISFMYPNATLFTPRDDPLLPFSFRFSVIVKNWPFADPKSQIVGKMLASTSSEGIALTAYFFDFGLSGVRIPVNSIGKDLVFHFGKSVVVNEETIVSGVHIGAKAKKIGSPARGEVTIKFPPLSEHCQKSLASSPSRSLNLDCVVRYDNSLEIFVPENLSWVVVGEAVTFGIVLFLVLIAILCCVSRCYPEFSDRIEEEDVHERLRSSTYPHQHPHDPSNLNSTTTISKKKTTVVSQNRQDGHHLTSLSPSSSPLSSLPSVSSFSSSRPTASLPLRLLITRRHHKDAFDDPSSLLTSDSSASSSIISSDSNSQY